MNDIIILLTLNTIFIFVLCLGGRFIVRYRSRKIKKIAEARLYYIRILIELVYTYSHKPELLLELLQTEMSVKKMMCCQIVDDICDNDELRDLKIRRNDEILYLLHKAGFSPKELCVIFGLNNLNSVYVKIHRVNKKINGDCGSNSGRQIQKSDQTEEVQDLH